MFRRLLFTPYGRTDSDNNFIKYKQKPAAFLHPNQHFFGGGLLFFRRAAPAACIILVRSNKNYFHRVYHDSGGRIGQLIAPSEYYSHIWQPPTHTTTTFYPLFITVAIVIRYHTYIYSSNDRTTWYSWTLAPVKKKMDPMIQVMVPGSGTLTWNTMPPAMNNNAPTT